MSNEIEGRVARLERAVAQTLNVNLHEFDDADQAAAYAKQTKRDEQAQANQLEEIRAELEAEAPPAVEPAPELEPAQSDEEIAATAAAQALAEEHGVDLSTVEPTGASGQIVKDDVAAVVEGA